MTIICSKSRPVKMNCLKKLKNHLMEMVFPPGTTTVSIKFLLTLAFSSLSYSMVVTMPFAYLPSMIKSFGCTEKEVGYYAGIVGASFYAGQTLASYFWGWLCDRIGSKSSHMTTTMLLMIMTIVFGLSKNIGWGIGARFSQGIIGTILVTAKAASFIVCDKTNNGIALAFITSSIYIGNVLGPALGGYLVYPCRKFPTLCSRGSLFDVYPFLLPNLVCSSCLFLAIVLSYCYIPSLRKPAENDNLDSNSKKGYPNERSRIHGGLKRIFSYDSVIKDECYAVLSFKSLNTSDERKQEDKHIATVSYFYVEEHRSNASTKGLCKSFQRFIERFSIFQLIRLKEVVISVGFYAMMSYVNIAFSEVYPVFADSPRRYGGLQFSSDEIGRSLLLPAVPLIFFPLVLPKLNIRFGETMIIVWTYYITIFSLPLFPLMSALSKSNVWFVLVLSIILLKCCICSNIFAVNMMLNNSTPLQLIGAVNGLGMTVSCLFRMLGPATLGPLYTWSLGNEGRTGFPFNHCFSFVLMGFFSLMALFLTIWMPKKQLQRHKIKTAVDDLKSDVSRNDVGDKPDEANVNICEDLSSNN